MATNSCEWAVSLCLSGRGWEGRGYMNYSDLCEDVVRVIVDRNLSPRSRSGVGLGTEMFMFSLL